MSPCEKRRLEQEVSEFRAMLEQLDKLSRRVEREIFRREVVLVTEKTVEELKERERFLSLSVEEMESELENC